MNAQEEFDWVTDVNLKGTFFCMKTFIQYCINNETKVPLLMLHPLWDNKSRSIYTDCARETLKFMVQQRLA